MEKYIDKKEGEAFEEFSDFLADFLKYCFENGDLKVEDINGDCDDTPVESKTDDHIANEKCLIKGIYEDGKVVKVLFSDDTEETAVCDKYDVFDLRRGIEVCILHKALGGSDAYNNYINSVVKEYTERKMHGEVEELKKRLEEERAKAEADAAKEAKEANAETVDQLIKATADLFYKMFAE